MDRTRIGVLSACVLWAGCSSDSESPGASSDDTGVVADSTIDSTVDGVSTDDTATTDTTTSDTAKGGETSADAATTYAFTVVVEGSGTVTGPGKIDCGSSCTDSFDASVDVALLAKPAMGNYFQGWQQDCVSAGIQRACIVKQGMMARTVKAVFKPIDHNLVFVTSAKFDGNLGGRAGADKKCNDAAKAVGLPATFKAYLSTTDANGVDAIGPTTQGFIRMDGRAIAVSAADLFSFKILNPIRFDENGNRVPDDELAWTASAPPGFLGPSSTCSDWTSTSAPEAGTEHVLSGNPAGGPRTWTFDIMQTSCAAQQHLYCFMTDKSATLTPAKSTGRLAFLSTGIDGSKSQSAADAQCNTDATSAGITGKTFKAFRADATSSAASRISPTGFFVRPDGTLIGAAMQLTTPGALESGIWQNAAGNYVFSNAVWTGAHTPDVAGTSAQTCSGWTTATPVDAGTPQAIVGTSGLVNARWFDSGTPIGCNNSFSVYCVEE